MCSSDLHSLDCGNRQKSGRRAQGRFETRKSWYLTYESAFFSKILPKIEKVARGRFNTSRKLALQENWNRLSINPRENNQYQKNKICDLVTRNTNILPNMDKIWSETIGFCIEYP